MDKLILTLKWDLSTYSDLRSYGQMIFDTGVLPTYFCSKQDWNQYLRLLGDIHLKQLERIIVMSNKRYMFNK